MKHSLRFLRLSLCLALATVTAGVAQIPQRISYQASISDNSGEPIVDGQHALSLSLFDQISGGTAVWTEDHTVTTAGGVVSLVLGASTALDLPFDESYWLGVVVDGGEELAPRVELTTVPYAIRAAGVVDSSITGAAIASGHVVRSIGGLADDIELVAGAGMTITTQNQIMVLSSATGLTSVSSGNIVDATISSIDVADGGLSGVDIADNSLGAVDLAEGSVGTSEVADGSLTASDIASGQVVKSVNGLTDALTLAAGANITITPSGNALTIASTGGGGGGGGSTLDGAYDEGGAGVGRTITADAGAVDIQGAGGLTVAAAVGVGTTSPQKPLHVLDATTATMRLERSAGTNWDVLAAADDKFRIDEAAGTTSPLQIESGAPTNSIYVAADGDVGIGTNAPTTGPPAAQLHVVGTIFAEGNLQNWDGANGVTVTPAGVISASGNPLTLRRLSNGEVRISDDIRLSPFGATDAVVIEATSGEVGIGTTTPGAKLEIVSGDVLISNGWAYRQRVASGTATYLMGVAGGAGTEYMALAMPSLTGEIRFIGVTGSGDEKMRIEDDGDVGIGVAAPIARLDVAGAGNTSGTSSLRVFNTSGVNMIHARDDGVVGIGSSAPVAGRRL
ncbi:MAG: hypothetical protein HN559_21275, partial [Gemmatimonadetes bacterium]|nr:hypothetical protein [Gemmatimonadota bacterium]